MFYRNLGFLVLFLFLDHLDDPNFCNENKDPDDHSALQSCKQLYQPDPIPAGAASLDFSDSPLLLDTMGGCAA